MKFNIFNDPKRESIPKHLQNNKEYNQRRSHQRDQKQSNLQIGTVFVVLAVLVGAGLFVSNMDMVYLQDKKNITMSFSNNFQQAGEAPIVITLTDFDDAPISGQEVKIELEYTQANNTKRVTLGEVKTDGQGVVTPKLKLPDDYNGSAELIVTVNEQKLKQPIIIDGPAAGNMPYTEEVLKILISTDKPLYQPGQMINIRTLAMYGEARGVYTENITIEIDDPEGSKLFRAELDCNEYGIASTNFTVTDQMSLGNYKITAKVGDKESKKSVTVKEYVLPRFRISFDEIKSWYTVDENIEGAVLCNYFFGKPVKGDIELKLRTYYGGIWKEEYHTSGKLTEDGEFSFNIPAIEYVVGLPINQDNGLVELNATITDPSGHSETKLLPISIARQPILITAISDTNLKGAESKYYILAQSPDGSIINNANYSAHLDASEVWKGKTNAKGLAEVNFKYDDQTELNVTVEKGTTRATEVFELIPSTGLKLVSDKLYYSVGNRAEFDVYYSGDSFTKWVYYDVISNGFTVTTGAFKLSSGTLGKAGFELDITTDMVGSAYVRVYKIEKDETVVTDRLELAVAPVGELNVKIEKDDEIYNPHQPVTLRFTVTEGETAVQGALGISMIDQALYALSEQYGGFTDIYFELEQTALEPRYQVWEYMFSPDVGGSSDRIPLPQTSVLDPGAYEEGYSYPKIGLQNNYNTELDNAKETKTYYLDMYWAGIFIFVFIGLVGVMFYGIRRPRPALAMGMLCVLVIATVLGGIMLNLDTLETGEESELAEYVGFSSPSDPDKKTDDSGPGGNQSTDGDGMADKAAEEPMDEWEEVNGGAMEDRFPAPAKETGIMDGDDDNDGYTDFDEKTSGTDPLDENPSSKREQREVHVREYFPETWYWNPVLITDESGTAELELMTPDSITTWEIKAVANTKNAKLGMANENLTVFQQFFIEPDIPVSVIRNDTFPLRIMVYNYDNISHEITVYLEEDTWFEALDDTTKKVTVPADNVSKVMFNIRALEVGEHNVTVSGYNGKGWDDVIKPMRVDPDGKRVSDTMNGKLSDNQTKTETITLTEGRVPGSENAFVKLQAGMEAVLLDGAESFIRFVSGCGEQSMSTLNIDILAFDTVQKLDTATEEKMFEYETIVTQGIQHELQYLMDANNGQGRGIVWFPGDEDVHQWLTSWGVITFQDAIDAGFEVDQAIITDMQSWLISQQETDGSFVFPERGLYEFTNPILRAKTISCSAYITHSLIYSGYSPTSTAVMDALGYIEDHAKETEVWDDPYTLALVLTVLEDGQGDSTLRSELASRLDELKVEDPENGTVYWSSGSSMITDSDDMDLWEGGYGYGSNYHLIETTGYAVMALAKNKGPGSATVQKGIRYLVENRQGLGGWYSTQDTIVAFQALKVAGMNNIQELTIQISADGVPVDQIEFDETNVDITYLIDLRPYLVGVEKADITITTTGAGSVMYQIYYEEYMPWDLIGVDKPQELVLNISYDTTNIKVDDRMTATLDLSYLGSADHIKMVLVDLRAPVGFSFVEADFEDMKADGKISQYEINDRQAYLYIQDLSYGQTITVIYHLEANDPIRGTIQGILAYDMYNPELAAELEPVEVTVT